MTEFADQAIDTAAKIASEVEAKLAAVAKSLREASASAMDLSEEASAALSSAATEVVRVAETLRKSALGTAKDAGRQAAHEVQEHPLVSIAAALAAVGAVAGMIVMTRRVGKAN
jgi:ElaB/YqjD/DUF883 family membrane-anchored ribosome-binding protein